MAEATKVGVRVEIIGKNLRGTVAYVGSTMFASGKWIGVVLDVPKGKNNGVVQGKRYFTCDENCGVFVRQQHIKVIADSGTPSRTSSDPPALKSSAGESRPPRTSSPAQPQVRPEKSEVSGSAASSVADREVSSDVLPQTPASGPTAVSQPSQKWQESPMASISALAGGVSMAEVESLRAQLKDWKDKFDTIRLKRQTDREKLKDMEKFRIQVQQLTEFKSRMSEQHQDLLKQLRDTKKEAKEAVESKERYIEEMADVHETVEMATLDKEMAEEKVETLQREVDSLKERNEELETDLEIMKAEIEDKGTDGAASSYQMKQMEEQNSRLKEALLRMRDLSAAEKTEHQNLGKTLEAKSKQLEEVTRKCTKLAEELENAESTIDELKEQVDAAVVAEEMVEQLTDKNLQLEEKLADFEEQVHDLETMNEMNEELQDNARESEMELREEVDLARSAAREAERKSDAANDVIADYQDTIKKFRKLVGELQETNQELREQQSGNEKSEGAQAVPQQPAIDHQIKLMDSKAAARSIDLDIRKLEAAQANEHVRYLSMFMPGLFSRQAGDQDCVQVVLLVQRISKKAEIIAKHVTDHFEMSTPIVLGGGRGDQLTFASSVVNLSRQLQTLMNRYEMSLTSCSVELFQKVGTLNCEMAPYERALDFLLEQLRRGTLDETTNLDPLVKAIEFFKHLYGVHMSREQHYDCWNVLDDYINQSNTLLQSIQINSMRMRSFLKDGQETSDIAILLRDVDTASSDVKQFCRKLRRRMPQAPEKDSNKTSDSDHPMLDFDDSVALRIQQSEESLFQVDDVLKQAVAGCVSTFGAASENVTLPHQQIENIFAKVSAKVFSVGSNGYEATRLALGNIMATVNALVTSLQEGEFDTSAKRPKVTSAVERRAQVVKAEINSSEDLARKLAEKDAAIQDLRNSLKTKAGEIGEAKIRIGMLERKVEKSGKVEEEQLSRLRLENDNLKEELKKKEREYDETLDALQGDIDTLEYERSELKQRLLAQAKRGPANMNQGRLDSATRQGAGPSSIASILQGAEVSSGVISGTEVVVEDSPLMQQQIRALQIALLAKKADNYKLMGRSMLGRLRKLSALKVAKKKSTENEQQSASVRKLHMDLGFLKEQIQNLVCTKAIDISTRKPGVIPAGSKSPEQLLIQEQARLQIAREKVASLQIKACQLMAAPRQVVSFPSPESPEDLVVGSLSLPKLGIKTSGSAPDKLLLMPGQLASLHSKIIEGYGDQPM